MLLHYDSLILDNHLNHEGSAVAPSDVSSGLAVVAASSGARHSASILGCKPKSRASRWDIPPGVGSSGFQCNFQGHRRVWTHNSTMPSHLSADKVACGVVLCRGSSSSHGDSDGQSYDTSKLRSPSPSLSTGTVDSRMGVLSSPAHVEVNESTTSR